MVVGTARDDLEATLHEFVSKHSCILLDLEGILLPLGTENLAEGNGLGSDDVLQWTALGAREYGAVEASRHHLHDALGSGETLWIGEVLTHHNDAATRTAERLVGGGGYDVGILHRIFEQTSSNEASRVSHIDHQDGTYLVGNLAHTGIVPFAAISRTATDDEFWLVLEGEALHLVVIDATGIFAHIVGNRLVEQTRAVDSRAVREVTTMGKIEAHEGVARIEHSGKHSLVGLCTRVGLHVCPACTEDLLQTIDGELLDLIDNLTTTIITLAGQTLGILVGKHRTHGLEHLVADDILGGNQFNTLHLTLTLLGNQVKDHIVSFHKII